MTTHLRVTNIDGREAVLIQVQPVKDGPASLRGPELAQPLRLGSGESGEIAVSKGQCVVVREIAAPPRDVIPAKVAQ